MRTRSVIRSFIDFMNHPAKSIPLEPEGSPKSASGSVPSTSLIRVGVVNDTIIQSGRPFVRNAVYAEKFPSDSVRTNICPILVTVISSKTIASLSLIVAKENN
jgi:hypothetical protein